MNTKIRLRTDWMETLCDSRWDIGGVPCRLGAKLLLLHTRNQLFSCATPGQLCHLLPLRGYMVSVRENACLFAAGMTDKPPVGPFGRPAIKRDYTMANQHITMPAYQHINRLTDRSEGRADVWKECRRAWHPTGWTTAGPTDKTMHRQTVCLKR